MQRTLVLTNPLSKKLDITVNGATRYSLEYSIDGQVIREEPKAAPFLASSLIWQDASGILGWRYILVIGLSWLSSFIFGKAIQNPDRKKLLLLCGTVFLVLGAVLTKYTRKADR